MYSWEILAIGLDEDSEYEDCRRVDKVGYRVAGSLKESQVDEVASKINSGLSAYHTNVAGSRWEVEAVTDGPTMYVRTLPEDSPDDPLLELPSISEWKAKRRFDI